MPPQVNVARVKTGKQGTHNPLLIILSPQTICKQHIKLLVVGAVSRVLLKNKSIGYLAMRHCSKPDIRKCYTSVWIYGLRKRMGAIILSDTLSTPHANHVT